MEPFKKDFQMFRKQSVQNLQMMGKYLLSKQNLKSIWLTLTQKRHQLFQSKIQSCLIFLQTLSIFTLVKSTLKHQTILKFGISIQLHLKVLMNGQHQLRTQSSVSNGALIVSTWLDWKQLILKNLKSLILLFQLRILLIKSQLIRLAHFHLCHEQQRMLKSLYILLLQPVDQKRRRFVFTRSQHSPKKNSVFWLKDLKKLTL